MTSRGPRGLGGPASRPSVSSAWMVLVVVVVVCWVVSGVVRPVGGSVHLILWGRCYSFCLQEHLQRGSSPSGQGELDTLPRNAIRSCQRHPTCRWCLYVCERPEDKFTNSTSCHRDCRHTRTRSRSRGRQACAQACDFVERAGHAKGGTCPAPGTLRGFQSACVTSCHGDGACSAAAEKCCSNRCGKVCTEPEDVDILPPVPGDLRFRMLKTGGVLINWEPGGDEPPGVQLEPPEPGGDTGRGGPSGGQTGAAPEESPPVVYIFRWWCPYTSGAVTSVTDRPRTRLQGYPAGIYPGTKCHFMVAAVNLHGSRGFSKVSPYIKQFLLPSPPLHLEEVRSRVHDGKVDVTIQWQPPVYTDGLPVFRYQVFWSDSLPRASPSYMRLHMHKRVLSPDRHSFVLHSLKMGTIYFVQVRAVVRWKKRQKVGKPASAYIETYAPPQQAGDDEEEEIAEGGRRGGSVIQSVRVNQSYYDHTVLKTHITWSLKPGKNAHKYLIYWKAETCAQVEHRKTHPRLETSATSHARSFTLYNLRPQCEYAVRVHAVNSRGRTRAATVTSFLTPSCHLIPVRQGEPPDCQVSETPDEVQGLHAETSDCETVVRWQPPSSPSPPLHAYDVIWGQTEAGGFSAATVIYSSEPRRLTVPANTTHAALGRLRAGDHFTIQVRGVSEGGSGPPSLLPLLVPHTDQPCASSSSSSSSVMDEDDSDVTIRPPLEATDDVSTRNNDTVDDKFSNDTTSSSPNRTHATDLSPDSTRDVTGHVDVTDDEDDVYFSGDSQGEVDSVIETANETDFYLTTSDSPTQTATHNVNPSDNSPKATNKDNWGDSNSTDAKGGARDPAHVNANSRTPLENSFPNTTPSTGGGGVRDMAVSVRTCWWTLLTSVLVSVYVCVARCFMPKS